MYSTIENQLMNMQQKRLWVLKNEHRPCTIRETECLSLVLVIKYTKPQSTCLDSTKKEDSLLVQRKFQIIPFHSNNFSHQKKIKTSGNAKAIDFYAGLELGKGPLNTNRKLWTDRVKEDQLNEELSSVQDLKKWEKNILKEVDPKY